MKHLIAGLLVLTILAIPALSESIELVRSGGVYMVPVRINDAITIPFVLDSGAADISVPEDVFKTLVRTGTVTESDLLSPGTYVNADGLARTKQRFILHQLCVGDHVIRDIVANVAPGKADPLLGQSFLGKLPGWAIDNAKHALVISDEGPKRTAAVAPSSAARPPSLSQPPPATPATPPKPVALAPKNVTVPTPHAKSLLTIDTRFGQVSVIRDADDSCCGQINYGAQKIELASADRLYATLVGIYRVKEGDVLVLDVPTGARGVPSNYHVFLVNQDRISELRSPDFSSQDFTFEVTQKGEEIYFNLGIDKQRNKTAVYRDGILSVSFEKKITSLPKKECASVLNMAASCVTQCPSSDPNFPFAMSWLRDIRMLEHNMPVFTERKFVEVCVNICTTKVYDALQSRQVLCGY